MKKSFFELIKLFGKHGFNINFIGLIASCVFLVAVGFVWLFGDLINGFEAWVDNNRADIAEFHITDFPNRYHSEMARSKNIPKRLDYTEWMSIWYTNSFSFDDYKFKSDILRQKSAILILMIQIPHPIWTSEGISLDQLNRLPNVNDYDSFSRFTDVVNQIAVKETKLAQNLEWQQKVNSWELLQIQSRVMFIYLVYLDQHDELAGNVESELDTLINQVGSIGWYQQFQEHLNSLGLSWNHFSS
ncbi:MAG: hypothetical protein KDE51_16295 [Anaerolineales bacterium]|nr:hypothetical protein [Anaerolineales bacterium]